MRVLRSLLDACDFGQWIAASAACLGLSLFGAVLAPIQAASGGPDAFGYTWADAAGGGPSFDYVILTTASDLGLGDDGAITVPIGFSFEFYGTSYTDVTIHSNGGISFGSSSALPWANLCPIMSSSVPNLAAPFWDDLNPSASTGGIYAGTTTDAAGETIFVAEWWMIQHYQASWLFPDDLTLEIKLFESDGHIEFHYLDVNLGSSSLNYGNSASVGLIGSSSLSSSCDSAALSDNYAIGFYPPNPPCPDNDGDGSCTADDCDDWDASIYPGALELCDGVDNDCDVQIDEGFDNDGDGWTTCEGDCDDWDATTSPGALEICDGADNDCDGQSDEGFDADGDGWSICDGDCDDLNASLSPGSAETCDGLDNNCDGQVDEGFDNDGDGWASCDGDCDDWDSSINPGAFDIAGDGIDQDCDGSDTPVGDDDDDDDTVSDDDDDDDTVSDDDDDDDDTVSDDDDDDDDSLSDDDDTVSDDDDSLADDDDSLSDDDDSLSDDDDDGPADAVAADYSEVEFGCRCAAGSSPPKGLVLSFVLSLLGAILVRRRNPIGLSWTESSAEGP